MSIIVALVVFTAVVVVHELGHFFAARRCGVLVEEFAVGMGPKLFGVKRGETEFTLRLFPIGGSCRMLGDDENSNNPRSFNAQTVGKRIIVIVGGVVMNVALALVIGVLCMAMTGYYSTTVATVYEDMPAHEAGLQAGDRIVRADGTGINIFEDFQFKMMSANGSPVELEVVRDGKRVSITITPLLTEDGYKVGFSAEPKAPLFGDTAEYAAHGIEKATFLETAKTGCSYVIYTIKSTYVGLARIVTGGYSADQMMGPIGLVGNIGETYDSLNESAGNTGEGQVYNIILTVLLYTNLLSANLAVINLLPIPALDGGRLVFLIIEAIRKKPLNPEKEGMIHLAGFVLLMIFAVFVACNDVMKML